MDAAGGAGRRSFNRLVLRAGVRLSAGGFCRRAVLLNVSAGGMFLLGEELSPGSQVEVSFSLPGMDIEFSCGAVVVWRRRRGARRGYFPPGSALAFLDMDRYMRRVIDRYVSTSRSLNALGSRVRVGSGGRA